MEKITLAQEHGSGYKVITEVDYTKDEVTFNDGTKMSIKTNVFDKDEC